MSQISPVLRNAEGGALIFRCPGCARPHRVNVGDGPGPRWGWNGNAERPTFTPSVLVRYDGADAGRDGAPPAVCHSFVTDGNIQFLADCTHALAGQTMPLGSWDTPA